MSATAPVQAALSFTDWRGVFLSLAVMTTVVAVAVWKVVPEKAIRSTELRLSDQLKGVAQVFTSPLFWRVAPLATSSQAAFMSIQSLWAGPWLRDVANLGRSEMAGSLMLLAAAMAVSYILLGTLTEWLSRHGVKPLATSVTGMTAFMGTQALIVFGPVEWHVAMWVLFGFFGTTGVITYAALTQLFRKDLAGRLNTALNLMVFVAAFAAQWGIGAIIDLFPVTAAGHYEPQGYRVSFAVLLGLQTLSLAWYFVAAFLNERS
jgi:predicted MFS family arabinose efflux permease